jgi:5-methyltetrahydropteroyltriglutamate--homocysteine methyltransferase
MVKVYSPKLACEVIAVPPPYRADHVGSLLRPPELLQAREDYAAERITADELHAAEDEAVLSALAMQREVGIDIFSGGEYRRTGWSSGVAEAVDGVSPDPDSPMRRIFNPWQGPHGDLANASMTMRRGVATSKLRQVHRITGEEAGFLKRHSPGPWKMTMPGAASVTGQLWKAGVSDAAYASRGELIADVVAMLQREVDALIDDGAAYIQLDSLHYVERIADTTQRQRMIDDGDDPDAYLDEIIAADNAVLGRAKGRGVTVALHMCRGNNRSAWHAEGGYEPIAERTFSQLNVDRFLLEYDTARAGGFEPLRYMPKDKVVVLGLISSKEPALESIDRLRRRIDEAAKYVPIENLAISPQCGFASTYLGNLLTWEEQRRKLELVVATARAVWG